jgi:hypothetical protein
MGERAQFVVDEFGNATVVDWNALVPPIILAQITENWFVAENFARNTELSYSIYDADGETILLGPETMSSERFGCSGVWVGDRLDLLPGQYITITDGLTTKDLQLEALTFDVFDPVTGYFQGTTPEPSERTVWVGIGWEDDGWSVEIITDENSQWSTYYGSSIPGNYQWVAAQVLMGMGISARSALLRVL